MSFISTISAASIKAFQNPNIGDGLLLTLSTSNGSAWKGSALSADGNYYCQYSGSNLNIYNFNDNIFTLQQTITNVNIQGNTLQFSGTGDRLIGGNIGNSVLVYSRTGNVWSLEQTLTPNDAPQTNFAVGTSINYYGNVILVGESGYGTITNTKGNVYYYNRANTTWTQTQKFASNSVSNTQNFGTSISTNKDGNIAIIGAPGNSLVNNNGGIYFFTRTTNSWTQNQNIAVSGYGGGEFVNISNDGLYALAKNLNLYAPTSTYGNVITYQYTNTWSTVNTLTKPNINTFTQTAYLSSNGNFIGAGYYDSGMVSPLLTKYQLLSNVFTNTINLNIPNATQTITVDSINEQANLFALRYSTASVYYWSILNLT